MLVDGQRLPSELAAAIGSPVYECLEGCIKDSFAHPRLQELLLGFHEVIPAPLLFPFDCYELARLLHSGGKMPKNLVFLKCQSRTTYTGAFESLGTDHPTCQWFWDILQDFDPELQARLLHWIAVTADADSTSGSVTTAFFRDATTDTVPWELRGVHKEEGEWSPIDDRSISLNVAVVRVGRRGNDDDDGGAVVIVLPLSASKDDLRTPLEVAVRGAAHASHSFEAEKAHQLPRGGSAAFERSMPVLAFHKPPSDST